ncbi:MAG TPA: pilin [Candidatus Saccharimonadales bacterium]|nr:pilin [Candidatus Saccharimonadales bacterium]
MLKTLRKIFGTIAAAFALAAVSLALPALVAAAPAEGPSIDDNLGCGANLQVDTGNCTVDTSGGTERIQSIITTGINIFSVIVGIVAVVMIIIGGFKYITSGGDSGNITSAKNTIIYAVIGLVIVALAQFFVQFVLNKVNG